MHTEAPGKKYRSDHSPIGSDFPASGEVGDLRPVTLPAVAVVVRPTAAVLALVTVLVGVLVATVVTTTLGVVPVSTVVLAVVARAVVRRVTVALAVVTEVARVARRVLAEPISCGTARECRGSEGEDRRAGIHRHRG